MTTTWRGAQWDVALTDEELSALAKGISPLAIRPDHLTRWSDEYGQLSGQPIVVGKLTVEEISAIAKATA